MTKNEAIEYFGSMSKLAKALGVTKQAVGQWKLIPVTRQYQVQVLSNNKLIAEMSAGNNK